MQSKRQLSSNMRRIWIIIATLLVFALGFWAAWEWFRPRNQLTKEEQATVLLEKIQTVAKMVTVEGYFSELYSHQDYWKYDWWIFRKKALLRVKAKVSVGYDLERMKIETFPDEKRIVISNVPVEPQLISIDHQVDYYDISEGTFNSFSPQDYSAMQKKARELIEQKAKESSLFPKAREQGIKILDLITFMGTSAGWEVEVLREGAAEAKELPGSGGNKEKELR
jgi:Protein of unknown function (DUF4230)